MAGRDTPKARADTTWVAGVQARSSDSLSCAEVGSPCTSCPAPAAIWLPGCRMQGRARERPRRPSRPQVLRLFAAAAKRYVALPLAFSFGEHRIFEALRAYCGVRGYIKLDRYILRRPRGPPPARLPPDLTWAFFPSPVLFYLLKNQFVVLRSEMRLTPTQPVFG